MYKACHKNQALVNKLIYAYSHSAVTTLQPCSLKKHSSVTSAVPYIAFIAGDDQPPTIVAGEGVQCYGKATIMQSEKVEYVLLDKLYTVLSTCCCVLTSETRTPPEIRARCSLCDILWEGISLYMLS